MSKLFAKLVKQFKTKKLKLQNIDEDRECDAFVASLLGWKHIQMDNSGEWTGDTPTKTTVYNCIGKCVIPTFTTSDSLLLLNTMIETQVIKPNSVLNIEYTNGVYSGIYKSKKADITITTPTLSLFIVSLYISILYGK